MHSFNGTERYNVYTFVQSLNKKGKNEEKNYKEENK